jgi:hypothetical protein
MVFHVAELRPNIQFKLSSDFYIRPKNFSWLSDLGKKHIRIMQFGFFGEINELLFYFAKRLQYLSNIIAFLVYDFYYDL